MVSRRAFALRLLGAGTLCALGAAPAAAVEAAPLFARYAVTVSPAGSAVMAQRQVWTFSREPARIVLRKGAIDEVWQRDAQGRIRFERVFHDEQRTVDYSPGELATLGVQADWDALGRFVDARALAALRVVAREGAAAAERVVLAGTFEGEHWRVDWRPALQVPARVTRRARSGAGSDIRLLQHAATPPAAWPLDDARAADYLRLDAADFGDMGYDKVVRLSEALDVRLGWRKPHAHD